MQTPRLYRVDTTHRIIHDLSDAPAASVLPYFVACLEIHSRQVPSTVARDSHSAASARPQRSHAGQSMSRSTTAASRSRKTTGDRASSSQHREPYWSTYQRYHESPGLAGKDGKAPAASVRYLLRTLPAASGDPPRSYAIHSGPSPPHRTPSMRRDLPALTRHLVERGGRRIAVHHAEREAVFLQHRGQRATHRPFLAP